MTPGEWERCADPDTMLHALSGQADDRRCRLFTCACCRRVWPLLADERSRAAVETAERYADGLADRDELATAEAGAQAVAFAEASARARAGVKVSHVTQATLAATGERADATIWAAWATAEAARAPAEERRHQCALLRCIFGNPFCPPAPLTLVVRAYNSSAVRRLAESIYEGRRFEDLPVLADLLEEAGCTDAALLGHLRGPGPHALGCHALDVVLGRT